MKLQAQRTYQLISHGDERNGSARFFFAISSSVSEWQALLLLWVDVAAYHKADDLFISSPDIILKNALVDMRVEAFLGSLHL